MKDLLDRKQLRMHLDCVFNIAGDDVCVLMDSIIGDKSSAYRLVDEYTLVEGEVCRALRVGAVPVQAAAGPEPERPHPRFHSSHFRPPCSACARQPHQVA